MECLPNQALWQRRSPTRQHPQRGDICCREFWAREDHCHHGGGHVCDGDLFLPYELQRIVDVPISEANVFRPHVSRAEDTEGVNKVIHWCKMSPNILLGERKFLKCCACVVGYHSVVQDDSFRKACRPRSVVHFISHVDAY